MKVERKFSPLTITLETEKEVELMNHVFNCGFDTSLKLYCKDDGLDAKELEGFTVKMWRKIEDLCDDC